MWKQREIYRRVHDLQIKRLEIDLAGARREISSSQGASPRNLEEGTQAPNIHVGAMHFPLEIFSGSVTDLETHNLKFKSIAKL